MKRNVTPKHGTHLHAGEVLLAESERIELEVTRNAAALDGGVHGRPADNDLEESGPEEDLSEGALLNSDLSNHVFLRARKQQNMITGCRSIALNEQEIVHLLDGEVVELKNVLQPK